MPNEILIYGVVGEEFLTAQAIKTQLASFDQDDELVVRIDSPGGSVFQGFSIYQAFAEYPGQKRCVIESAAFSIASYIAMAFDEIEIAGNGYLMIHNPSVMSDGDDEQHAKDAQLLAKLKQSMIEAYSNRTGMNQDKILDLMKEETYFNATEAKTFGFVSKVLNKPVSTRIGASAKDRMPYRVAASLFSDSPDGKPPQPKESEPMADDTKPVAASVKEIRAAFPKMPDKFVIECLDKELPMASVAGAAAEELLKENEALKAQIAAMEEEKEEAAAKAAEEAKAAEAEEAEAETAKAAARGADPIARAGSQPKSATSCWTEAVNAELKRGVSRVKAVQLANRRNPGLRTEYLEEVNAS